MTSPLQRRAAVALAVGRVTRSAAWRQVHPELHQTIIPVLPDDTVDYVLDMLGRADDQDVYLASVTEVGVRLVRLGEELWSLSLPVPGLPGGQP